MIPTERAPALPGLFDLSRATALVTGASRGIGATVARTLDGAGARVILCARNVTQLHELSGALDNDPVMIRADLSEPDGIDQLLTKVGALVERVDILVNNAGIHHPAHSADLPVDAWDRVVDVNLRSAFLLTRGLAPAMARAGWGKVVNVASILGLIGDVCAAPYVTSKAGLLGLTRALAAEWAAYGVGINALCPGWIETDMVAELRENDAFTRRVVRRTPAARWGNTADLAGPILFLASHASDFMVGQALAVDGGITATW